MYPNSKFILFKLHVYVLPVMYKFYCKLINNYIYYIAHQQKFLLYFYVLKHKN